METDALLNNIENIKEKLTSKEYKNIIESLSQLKSKKVYKMTAFIPVLNHRTVVDKNCGDSDDSDDDSSGCCRCIEISEKYSVSVQQFTFLILDSELNNQQKEMFERELQNTNFNRTNTYCLPDRLGNLIKGLTGMDSLSDHNLWLFSWKIELV